MLIRMLIRMLIDSVAKDGNLLLNVGPNGRGEFEPRALERLRDRLRLVPGHESLVTRPGTKRMTNDYLPLGRIVADSIDLFRLFFGQRVDIQ